MGYCRVRYDSRVVNYDRKLFIRLATGFEKLNFLINNQPAASFRDFRPTLKVPNLYWDNVNRGPWW